MLEVGQTLRDPLSSALLTNLAVVVIPHYTFRKGISHFLHVHVLVNTLRLGHLRCDKDARAEHELGGDVPELLLMVWELVPHGRIRGSAV